MDNAARSQWGKIAARQARNADGSGAVATRRLLEASNEQRGREDDAGTVAAEAALPPSLHLLP